MIRLFSLFLIFISFNAMAHDPELIKKAKEQCAANPKRNTIGLWNFNTLYDFSVLILRTDDLSKKEYIVSLETTKSDDNKETVVGTAQAFAVPERFGGNINYCYRVLWKFPEAQLIHRFTFTFDAGVGNTFDFATDDFGGMVMEQYSRLSDNACERLAKQL